MKNLPGAGANQSLKLPGLGCASAWLALAFCAGAIVSAKADSFTTVGSMNVARWYQMATLLQNGQVLVVGNDASAELYNPATGKWTLTASRSHSGGDDTATLLPNGFVMLAGGGYGDGPTNGTELYNPVTGTWQPGTSMSISRESHTATRLLNGKILVTGGATYNELPLTCELYDPTIATWSNTGALNGGRYDHSATLLQDGRVLVAGGYPPLPTNFVGQLDGTNTAEIYNPVTGLWTPTGSMANGRAEFSSLLLPNGKVFVIGGTTNSDAPAELFDPGSGTWSSAAPMNNPRWSATATLLANGTVLVAGGDSDVAFVTNAEIYDPVANSWKVAATVNVIRLNNTATLLPSGQVLFAGGLAAGPWDVVASAEVYDPGINPSTGTWTNSGSMSAERTGHTLTLLPNGEVLAAGGTAGAIFSPTDLASADLYDSMSGTWTPANPLPKPRTGHTANLLATGKVLVAGGIDRNSSTTYYNSARLYDPVTGAWINTGSMNQTRACSPVGIIAQRKSARRGRHFLRRHQLLFAGKRRDIRSGVGSMVSHGSHGQCAGQLYAHVIDGWQSPGGGRIGSQRRIV